MFVSHACQNCSQNKTNVVSDYFCDLIEINLKNNKTPPTTHAENFKNARVSFHTRFLTRQASSETFNRIIIALRVSIIAMSVSLDSKYLTLLFM